MTTMMMMVVVLVVMMTIIHTYDNANDSNGVHLVRGSNVIRIEAIWTLGYTMFYFYFYLIIIKLHMFNAL